MKVLFIVPYSSEGASNRYRVEQYIPYLKAAGIGCDLSPFVFAEFYRIIYSEGRYCKKTIYFIRGLFRRITDIFKLYKYDAVFIHREACPFGWPIFEWLIFISGKPIIFDFDDAIFIQNFNPVNKIYSFLKSPSKTKKIIKMASSVIVANRFLQEYAHKFNSHIYILPTSIDTERFKLPERISCNLEIGWVGSPTTAPYLNIVSDVIKKLSKKYDFIFKVVGVKNKTSIPGVRLEYYDWQLDREIQDFQNIDIGIYPLPDTIWAKGKAGFKAIQYMAVGVPVVASAVGMAKEIIEDGINGFLANSYEEWIEKISKLIENPDLRKRIGLAGRKTVEKNFSVEANAPKFLKIIESYA